MACEGSCLLSGDIGVRERLGEGAAPAMEVHRQREVGLLEQLALAARQLAAHLVRLPLVVPDLDTKRAPQVAAEGVGVAHLELHFAGTLATPGGEDESARGATVALPPVPEDAAKQAGHLEQLRALGLAARRPAPLEAALGDVKGLPVEAVEIARSQATEAAGHASHHLALQNGEPPLFLGVLVGKVKAELFVGQHGALFPHLGAETGHGRVVHRVGADLTLAPERIEYDANGLSEVGDGLACLALRLAVVQRLVHVRRRDRAHRGIAERREGIEAEPGQFVIRAAHAVRDSALMHAHGGLLERFRGNRLGRGRGLARE